MLAKTNCSSFAWTSILHDIHSETSWIWAWAAQKSPPAFCLKVGHVRISARARQCQILNPRGRDMYACASFGEITSARARLVRVRAWCACEPGARARPLVKSQSLFLHAFPLCVCFSPHFIHPILALWT